MKVFIVFELDNERFRKRTVLDLDRRIETFEDIKAVEDYIKNNINHKFRGNVQILYFKYLHKTYIPNGKINVSGAKNLNFKKGSGYC